MRAGLRFGAALMAGLLAAAPAAAQDAATNGTATTTAPAPATDAIGPRELRDFSINGTVTRTAPPPAERAAPPPARTPPARTEAPAERPATGADTARPEQPRAERPSAAEPNRSPPSVTVALPPARAPLDEAAPSEPPPTFTTQPNLAPPILPEAATAPVDQGPSLLPWLLAALLLAAGAAYYAWRQQSRVALAGHGAALESFVPAEPARPAGLARVPASAAEARPRAAPPAAEPPPTIVSTALRPQIEVQFAPLRCIVDGQGARIEFEISLLNSGTAPAREVLLEACLFNAGPAQDQEIGAFFAHPVGAGNRLALLPPLQRLALKSAASLPSEKIHMFDIAGRQLFVPLIGFNALYRWSNGEGQTSASYLIGRDTNGEKMAPFRLDLGPRVFRGLGAREHHVRVRK